MPTLRTEALAKRFGGVEAVRGLTLAIEPGRITGLIGPNGAGKTTMVNLITGMLKPTSGRILFGERDITTLPPSAVARLGIARTFQNIRLLREASVLDNVVVGFHCAERTGFLSNLLGLPAARRERRAFTEAARALTRRFGMAGLAERPAGTLSYGHQRRTEMMRALAMHPALLLLDEPVAGMNDVEAGELGAIFRGLADDGLAVLLIEHNMRFVTALCDTLYVVASGQMIASGPPGAVMRDPTVISAYLGEDAGA